MSKFWNTGQFKPVFRQEKKKNTNTDNWIWILFFFLPPATAVTKNSIYLN